MDKYASWDDFTEARINAGLFISEVGKELGVSTRTLYRWKKNNQVPRWACRILCLLSGDLEHFGWGGWELKNGRLFNKNLNGRYHSWEPGEILAFSLYGGS